MTIIGSLNYRIGLDASEFARGAVLTRSEYGLLRAAARDTITPTEQFGAAVDQLGQVLAKGALDGRAYFQSLVAAQQELPVIDELQRRLGEGSAEAQDAIVKQTVAIAFYNAEATRLKQQLQEAEISENEYAAAIAAAAAPLRDLAAAEVERQAAVEAAIATEREAIATRERNAATVATSLAALREERDTLGMSAAELQAYQLATLGATEATIAEAAAISGEITALREATEAEQAAREAKQQLVADADALIARLTEERDTFGMTSREIDLYRLAQRGALAATIDEAQALGDEISALEREADAAKDAAAAERELERAHKADADAAQKHAREVQQVGQQALGAVPGVGRFSQVIGSLNPLMIGGALAAAGIALEFKLLADAAIFVRDAVREDWEEIDQLKNTADTIGGSVAGLQIMREAAQGIAGVDISATDGALRTLNKTIGDAVAGGKKATETFGDLKLNAAELAELPMEEALARIADRFQEIESPAARARLAQRLFGASGQELLPMLMAGSEGLDEAAKKMRDMGLLVEDFEAAGIKQMNDAWADVAKSVDGLTRQLAIDLAPTMQVMAEELTSLLSEGAGFGDEIKVALEVIPPVIATGVDLTNEWIGTLELAAVAAAQPGLQILEGLAAVDQAQAKLRGVNPTQWLQDYAHFFRENVDELAEDGGERLVSGLTGGAHRRIAEIREELGKDADEGQPTVGQAASGDESELTPELDAAAKQAEKTQEAVDKLTASLEEQVATLGMSTDEANRYKLAQQGVDEETLRYIQHQQETIAQHKEEVEATKKAEEAKKDEEQAIKKAAESLQQQIEAAKEQAATAGMSREEAELWKLEQAGASKEALAQVKALQEQARAQKEHADQVEAGKKLTEELRTPTEAYRDKLAELEAMANAGAISEETLTRARAKATEELVKSQEAAEPRDIAEQGTQEAMDRIEEQRKWLAGLQAAQDAGGALGGGGGALADDGVGDALPVGPGLGFDRSLPDLPVTLPDLAINRPDVGTESGDSRLPLTSPETVTRFDLANAPRINPVDVAPTVTVPPLTFDVTSPAFDSGGQAAVEAAFEKLAAQMEKLVANTAPKPQPMPPRPQDEVVMRIVK